MFTSPSHGTMPLDPTTQRAIEQLAFVLNDVEQRLQHIRMGIAHATPSWPNTFGQGPATFAPTSTPFGVGVPTLGPILSNPVLAQHLLTAQLANLHATGGVPTLPFGASPVGAMGVNAPFGFQAPFPTPFTAFRR